MRKSTCGALAALALLGAGCAGIGSEDDVTERVQGPSLLSKEQVERYRAGSPERTVFEWWRAIQFDNAVVGSGYYSSRLEITPAELERQLQIGSGTLGTDRRPRLVEVQPDGDSAVVLVVLDLIKRNPNGRVDRARTARAFNLEREQGEWKLAENLYLERIARIQARFARAARRAQQLAAQGAERQNGEDSGGAAP